MYIVYNRQAKVRTEQILISRSAIYDLDLVLDLEGVGLDLDLDLDLRIFSRDQHCDYIKYHTKKLLKSFTNRRKCDSMDRIHPENIHGLCTSIFIWIFFNFRLGPGVYTAALEKCMHAHSWTENQAAEIQLSVVSWS